MNELIKVKTNENNEQIVSGRELHMFLEIKTRYNDWFPRMIEYGFVENIDFVLVTQKRVTNNSKNPITEYTDHALNLDMAKEIAMTQRSEKGKRAREYFLKVEKAWNSPEMIIKRAHELLERKVIKLESKVEEMEPKALFADSVSASSTSILVADLAKLLKQNGVAMGQNKLFKWLRENEYLIRRQGVSFNMPTQKSMELCLFEIKESTYQSANGKVVIKKTSKVTGKGQRYFINKFLEEREGAREVI